MIIILRTIESTLRTMNNLLERLHASFFFYIMTGPQRFLKIGFFLPSAILISVAMMFHGLSTWVNAAWINETNSGPTEKENLISLSTPPSIIWRNRRRPVIPVLGIMISTHILGLLLFWTITRSWFMENYQVGLFIIISFDLTVPVFRFSRQFYSSFSPQYPFFSSLSRVQPLLIPLRYLQF